MIKRWINISHASKRRHLDLDSAPGFLTAGIKTTVTLLISVFQTLPSPSQINIQTETNQNVQLSEDTYEQSLHKSVNQLL